MAKPGNNKKRCEKYKQRGALERNKALKQERNEKRIAKFAKRREEGRCYVYHKRDPDIPPKEPESNIGSKQGRHTPYAILTSIFAKLNRYVVAEKAAEKIKTRTSQGSEV